MQTVDRVMGLFRDQSILRPQDLHARGMAPASLSRLCRQGKLLRLGRGQYSLPGAGYTEHHSLAEACSRVPNGVICLLSALQFHQLGTQSPFQVWMAVDRKARRPQVDGLPLRVVRFSGLARTEGVEDHTIEGVTVRVYNPAKTVVDCFKYRNKIGLDVALEALRECRRHHKCTNDDLWHYASICRVANVMRPFLEATA